MIVVGLISCYKEGRLLAGAVESLERVGLDKLYLYEGPAGRPIADDLPDSEIPDRFHVNTGRWRTDARKRQAMLDHVLRDFGRSEPVWGVILDGDEILVNGQYLRDILQARLWNDELEPDGMPWARYPLRLVEADGAMSMITGRVVRLDLLRSYDASTSAVTNVYGVKEGWGNVIEDARVWIEHFLGGIDRGRMSAWPPLPCEPHIFHRSHLRHPARRGVRMSDQETVELAKLKAKL